jgi:hypothetical protein
MTTLIRHLQAHAPLDVDLGALTRAEALELAYRTGWTGDESMRETCRIRGCGVVAVRFGTHCRRHQSALDRAANLEDSE